MDIKKSPQYDLYTFTKFIHHNKDKLVPSSCGVRCLYSTIINRCYYSSYLWALFWLEDQCKFKLKKPFEFDDDEEYITEHKQVRLALKEKGLETISSELFDLFNLRKKADYDPLCDISLEELSNAMDSMELIFKNLTF